MKTENIKTEITKTETTKTENTKTESAETANPISEHHYLISETAKLVGVETHVLRYWEEELKLPIRRNDLGHRYYTSEDVEQFKEIKKLKEQGLQLKAIRTVLTDSSMQVIVPLRDREIAPPHAAEELTEIQECPSSETVPSPDDKSLRLQMLLHDLIAQAVRENNAELTREIKETIMKEMDYQFRVQDEEARKRDQNRMEREEEHYRRLDELLREYSSRKAGKIKRTEKAGQTDEARQERGLLKRKWILGKKKESKSMIDSVE